jgi:polyadenylation factor subunit 2
MSFHKSGHSGGAGGAGAGAGQSAEDAEQEAAERNLIRRCVDYHGPAVLDLEDRRFHRACRSHHVRNSRHRFLQPHSSQFRCMGLPISNLAAPVPSELFLTYCAHVTRAKNSTPIICLSWTPGGRRLLTGNNEGEFTLWDGSTLVVFVHKKSFVCLWYLILFCLLFV